MWRSRNVMKMCVDGMWKLEIYRAYPTGSR